MTPTKIYAKIYLIDKCGVHCDCIIDNHFEKHIFPTSLFIDIKVGDIVQLEVNKCSEDLSHLFDMEDKWDELNKMWNG